MRAPRKPEGSNSYGFWREDPFTSWYIMCTGALLCGLIPGLLLVLTSGTLNPISSGWGPLLIAELSAVRLIVLLTRPQRRVAEMVFWVFTYLFMGLAPFVQYRRGVVTGTTPHIELSRITDATLAVLLGCAAWILGSALVSHVIRRQNTRCAEEDGPERAGVTGGLRREVSETRVWVLCLLAVVIVTYYVVSLGGPQMLFLSRAELGQLREAVWPNRVVSTMTTGLATMSVLVGFISAYQVARTSPPGPVRNRSTGLAVGMAVVLLLVFNPVSTPRYLFGTALLAVLAVVGVYSTRTGYRIMATAAVLGLVFVFPLADLFRYSLDESFGMVDPTDSFISGDFDSFNQVVNSLEYVANVGPSQGVQLLGAFLFWVPRALWVGKPEATGILLAEYKGYDFTNLSAPIWAEGIVNFGILGAVLVLFVAGVLVRVFDQSIEVALSKSPAPGVLGCILPFYLLMLWRGSLMVAVADLVVILLCWWIATRWSIRGAGPVAGRRTDVRPRQA